MRGVVGLLAGLAVTTALCGCASSASPSLSAVPFATSGPSAPAAAPPPSLTSALGPTAETPTPSPTPSAITYGKATLTSGVLACKFVAGGTVCSAQSNDLRVTGTLTETVHADGWGTDPMHGVELWSGPARLENAGGTWEGKLSGIFASGLGPVITYWYTGSGGYAGLSYFEEVRAAVTGGDWSTTGLIFPGSPPAR